jgi:hypothetical protein
MTAIMKRIAFADESGLNGLSPCYAIGVVSFDHECLRGFEEYFQSKLESHGVVGEAKWKKIRNSHGLINFGLDALYSILHSHSASLDVIVVDIARYRNWNSIFWTHEDAFYQTFTFLLNHIAARAGHPTKIFIDDRSDSYSKQDEKISKIGNNMLAQLASTGRLESVQKIESHNCVGVQVADVLTGAINAAHARKLKPRIPLHLGKSLAIERLAEILGWDDLCYDTLPSDKINIWHFPIQYRAFPATLPVLWGREPRYISAVDLLRCRKAPSAKQLVVRKSA